jgi:Ca2+/Na+ antiporter
MHHSAFPFPPPEVPVRAISIAFGGVIAVALTVAGLWAWGNAAEIVEGARQPYNAKWAVRSGAVAAVAAAQAALLFWVVGRVYRRQALDDALRLSALVVFLVALVGAVTLGVTSR